MQLCDVKYGDFVIWSEQELIVLRITVDDEFLDHAIEPLSSPRAFGKMVHKNCRSSRYSTYQHYYETVKIISMQNYSCVNGCICNFKLKR